MSIIKLSRCTLLAAIGLLMTVVAGAACAEGVDPWAYKMTPHAVTYGDRVDFLYELIYWIVMVTFVGVEGVLVYFLIKYRKRANPAEQPKVVYTHGSDTLELVWTIIPAVILLFIALIQRDAWMDIKSTFPHPKDKQVVQVELQAKRFEWSFRYAGKDGKFGSADDVISSRMVIPKDHVILMQMRSVDVLHSFFLPHFRVKQDTVPGLTIPVWFEATMTTHEYAEHHGLPLDGTARPFVFEIACAELCGAKHTNMRGEMDVVTREVFDQWLEDKAPPSGKAWRTEWKKLVRDEKKAIRLWERQVKDDPRQFGNARPATKYSWGWKWEEHRTTSMYDNKKKQPKKKKKQ